MAGQQLPESLGVVGVDQVAQLMDSHVIPDGVGALMMDQLQITRPRLSQGTGMAAAIRSSRLEKRAWLESPNWCTRARYWSSPFGPVRTPGLRKARSMAQVEKKHIRRSSSVAESSWANRDTGSAGAGPGAHGQPDAPGQPAAKPGGEPARDRSARRRDFSTNTGTLAPTFTARTRSLRTHLPAKTWLTLSSRASRAGVLILAGLGGDG